MSGILWSIVWAIVANDWVGNETMMPLRQGIAKFAATAARGEVTPADTCFM
jgi:hypothetical protein